MPLLWLRAGGEESQDNVQDRLLIRNRTADPLTQAPQVAGWVHPRNETRTLDRAIPQLFRGNGGQPQEKSPSTVTRGKLVSLKAKQRRRNATAAEPATRRERNPHLSTRKTNSWICLDQSLRATDLLLQAGGFSVIVMYERSTLGTSFAYPHRILAPLSVGGRTGADHSSRTYTNHYCKELLHTCAALRTRGRLAAMAERL
jgi:hypothetical protein